MSPGPSTVRLTWRQLWRRAAEELGSGTEARWLVEDVSGLDAAGWLLACDDKAPAGAVRGLDELVRRRKAGEPLQHVLGHWSFRTVEVVVDRRVLVPRPETEVLVAHALACLDRLAPAGGGRELLAADLGTGSGVITLSLAAERQDVQVLATDRSREALAVASANLVQLPASAAARVRLYEGDWFAALPADLAGRLDLVASNPPYLAEHEWDDLDPVVRDFDPRGALVAGPSGFEALEAVIGQAPGWLGPHGFLLVELAPTQAPAALELARVAGLSEARVEEDLAGRPRVLVATR